MDRWCILRTKARNTLSLGASLAAAGYEVWTPTEHKPHRVGHSRERIERAAPIMPTYVFAHSGRALSLLALAADPHKDHVEFSVFHYRGRIPLIADRDLDIVRSVEARDQQRRERLALRRHRAEHRGQPLPKGAAVAVPTGPFAGLSGIVQESDGRFTLLAFGRLEVKIDTFLISPNEIEHMQPITGTAA